MVEVAVAGVEAEVVEVVAGVVAVDTASSCGYLQCRDSQPKASRSPLLVNLLLPKNHPGSCHRTSRIPRETRIQ